MESNPDGDTGVPLLIFLSNAISLQAFTPDVYVSLAIMLLLLFASAVVSGAEVAFFSMGKKEIRDLKEEISPRNLQMLELLQAPRTLLASILIANNLFNIGIVITSYYIVSKLFIFHSNWAKFAIEVVLVTFLLVVFGEVMPKILANYRKLPFARFATPFLRLMTRIFRPVSHFLVHSTQIIENRLARKHGKRLVTKEEIDHAIELARDESTTEEEIDILKGIVKFGDIMVKQIMRSRVDIVAIDKSSSCDEVLKIIRESGYSRFPVYEDDLDHIIGFLYAKDLLGYLDKGPDFDWTTLLREAFFVPENKKIEELLREFQRKRVHMAVVVDEYGGTSGVVTLEDIMEEIIGEIEDEHDVEEENQFEKIDEHTYIFEGKTLINDFCREMNIDSHIFDEVKGDSDSLAGLLLELFQRMPDEGESIRYNKYKFEVLEVSDRRIEKVKITITDDEEDDES